MPETILQTLYFILPAYLANASASVAAKVKWLEKLNWPVDGYLKIGKNYLFGPHKTYRGFIVGILFGILTVWVQQALAGSSYFEKLSILDYQKVNVLFFGGLAGFSALLGDLIGAFIKRRLNIPEGRPLVIVDQLNFIAGYFIFCSLLFPLNIKIVTIACLATLIIHPLTNVIAYFLKLKKVWW